jgi:hypothetical protein
MLVQKFVKITLSISHDVTTQFHERNAFSLRSPLSQRLNRKAGKLGDFFHCEQARTVDRTGLADEFWRGSHLNFA